MVLYFFVFFDYQYQNEPTHKFAYLNLISKLSYEVGTYNKSAI